MSHSCSMQALTIIAFNHGHLNLNTFKTILSIGPSFAIMNFVKSKMFVFSVVIACDLVWMASDSQITIFMMNRFLRCVAYFWGIHHCKGHGCFKTSYKVFLGWLDVCVCNICLPVSFEFPLCYYVMLLTVLWGSEWVEAAALFWFEEAKWSREWSDADIKKIL